jgi:tetratricopeptide (TPR) repeat protein
MSDRIAQLQQFIIATPTDPFLHYALALEWIKSNNTTAAQAEFEYLLIHHPDYLATYYPLAALLVKQGAHEKAVTIYQQGMALAAKLKDQHTFSELKTAYESFLGIENDGYD